jgi:hypothetical protein
MHTVNLFYLLSYNYYACFSIVVYKVRILCNVHICSCLQDLTMLGIVFIKENIRTMKKRFEQAAISI